MRITRFPSITEPQFFGCVAAFVDSLSGELNATASALRRLEGTGKGAAFAYEMTLDQHRYGALIVIDRWSAVVRAFAGHLELSRYQAILAETPDRAASAETILTRTNQLIDAADCYTAEIVEASLIAFRTVEGTFAEERSATQQYAKLGPMLPQDYTESRRIFLEDLNAR